MDIAMCRVKFVDRRIDNITHQVSVMDELQTVRKNLL